MFQGDGAGRAVALTFDDGPDEQVTPRILDALDARGAKATFFVVGKFTRALPHVVRDAHARGHEIGVHLDSHGRGAARGAGLDEELARAQGAIEQATGVRAEWLRFPYGELLGHRPSDVTSRLGVRVAHWTFSTLDSRAETAAAIVRRSCALFRPGAIVLMHDRLADAGPRLQASYVASREATVLALPSLLDALAQRRLDAVTLSTLVPRSANRT